MKPVSDMQHYKLRSKLHDALSDVDRMKEQLADIRACCAELEKVMRDIREQGEQAHINACDKARRRQQIKRIV